MKSPSTEPATKGDVTRAVVAVTLILVVTMTIYFISLSKRIDLINSRCIPAESK